MRRISQVWIDMNIQCSRNITTAINCAVFEMSKKILILSKHQKISNHPVLYFKITECPLISIWNNHISQNLLATLRFQREEVRISVMNYAFALGDSVDTTALDVNKCRNLTHSQASIFIHWFHWKFFKRDLRSLCCHAWSTTVCNLRHHVIVSTLTFSLWIWTTWIKGLSSTKAEIRYWSQYAIYANKTN